MKVTSFAFVIVKYSIKKGSVVDIVDKYRLIYEGCHAWCDDAMILCVHKPYGIRNSLKCVTPFCTYDDEKKITIIVIANSNIK